jgi:putative membrane protein
MSAGMVIFWALVIGAVVFLVRRPVRPEGHSAEDILAERYARGDIDHDEFERRRALIRQEHHPTVARRSGTD